MMKATLEESTSMSDTTTIHRDALNQLDPLDSTKSDRDRKAESFNLEFNVGELYGCVCHRPTTGIFTPQIYSRPTSA